jgi:hypothetical protein
VGNLTLRIRWYSGATLPGLPLIAGCIVWGFFSPGGFAVAAILAVGWVISKFATRIEVTSADVGLSTWLSRRKSAPREEVYAMHWYGRSFTFTAEDNRVLLSVPSFGWTRGQLLDMSEALGVHLYNHRTKRGLGSDAWKGQLMQRTSDDGSSRFSGSG